MFLLAGIATLSASATAFSIDPQIVIDRALNSPTLTVRYSGVTATLVELRVNGQSISTRAIEGGKSAGETNFTLSLAELRDGDNEVEIRLYDRTGKLVAKDKTNISTDQGQQGPVFLTTPKMGSSVQGPVEIKVGFGRELRNAYVSFFVDGNFKSMTNFPPFAFVWDSEKESNGWHEVEAWAIDDTNTTLKSRKVRLFVNNPGGRTNRPGVAQAGVPSRNRSNSEIEVEEKGLRVIGTRSTAVSAQAQGKAPAVVSSYSAKTNRIQSGVGNAAGLRSVGTSSAIATGPKLLTPTGQRVAAQPKTNKSVGAFSMQEVGHREIPTGAGKPVIATTAGKAPVLRSAPIVEITTSKPITTVAQGSNKVTSVIPKITAATGSIVSITRGTRLPNLTVLPIILNGRYVNFDVNPSIEDGIPVAPFRHLLEGNGGKVNWSHLLKEVHATADGQDLVLRIGSSSALVGGNKLSLERAAYLNRGRTIVPLSFLRDALKVNVEFDKETGHVLITKNDK